MVMGSTTTVTETDSTATVTTTRLALYGALTAITAIGVNALVRLLALGVFDVPSGYDPLGWAPILNTTIAAVIGATVLYGLLTRVSNRPNRTFAVVAAVVFLLSFVPLLVPPAFLADAPASVFVTLGVLHVTTAAVVLALLPRATTASEDTVK